MGIKPKMSVVTDGSLGINPGVQLFTRLRWLA